MKVVMQMARVPIYLRSIDGAIESYMRTERKTQEQVASEIGMSVTSLSLKRNGHRNFTAPELLSICRLIGLSVDETAMKDFKQAQEAQAAKSA